MRLVEKISLKDVPARVAATLLEFADGANVRRNGGAFQLPRTQEEIAGELATTRESISRALKRLRDGGTIQQEGSRVVIRDRAGLEDVAADGRMR